jgi:hypothetical protein
MINLLRQLCTKLWQLRMKTLAFQRNYLASEDAQLRKAPPRLRQGYAKATPRKHTTTAPHADGAGWLS